MRMGELEIHDYARQLVDAHGEMAVVEAVPRCTRPVSNDKLAGMNELYSAAKFPDARVVNF
jgi:hypothetical protein